MKKYNKTLIACYLGFITQAIAGNFAPLLFLTFHRNYNITLVQTTLIPTVLFLTQLIVDILCTKLVDRIGYRICIVVSEVLSAIGFISLAFLPDLLPDPFIGIIISVIIYAAGSGLIEVLCSPIVEACPFEHKESVMSTLHSFYCWGCVGVIALSTAFFAVFGIDNWKWMACFWALIPLANIFNFISCPIETPVAEGKGLGVRGLFKLPLFWIAIVLMICAGASELSMAQWASTNVEAAFDLSKALGDLIGPCLFAIMMGISRTIYGKFGDKISLAGCMIGGGILCLLCYIAASAFSNPIIGLLGCVFCGFSVGIMWPGTISLSSSKIPLGGTAMFALLAMAGDLGGVIGPGFVGLVSVQADNLLQAGIFAAGIFPIILVIAILLFIRRSRKQ